MKFIQQLGIDANDVVYVGNDMLNDISTARHLGLQTVLFAGDRRSLRLRKEENRQLQTCQPDAIITKLRELLQIVFDDHTEAEE